MLLIYPEGHYHFRILVIVCTMDNPLGTRSSLVTGELPQTSSQLTSARALDSLFYYCEKLKDSNKIIGILLITFKGS
jgi:hypothetical protein